MEKITVSDKLDLLLGLQNIDSKIDDIRKIRGDLPEEVKDLEDEVIGYETRIKKFKAELSEIEDDAAARKSKIKEAEKLIKKYTEQQMNVRNDREYGAITKEIELQELEIKVSEKKINEIKFLTDKKKEEIEGVNATLKERKNYLDNKKSELDVLISESEGEEEKLVKQREKAAKKIEERLIYSYDRLRNNARNGLAVVTVKRGACGGCFNTVPHQRQAEIRERKKIIVCEHCGRVLADVDDVVEEEPAPKKRRTTSTKKKAEAKK